MIGGGEETSSNFRAKHIAYYKEYVDLLVQQKQPEEAFHVFERLRARELLKILTTHMDLSKGEDGSLLAQQRSLAAEGMAHAADVCLVDFRQRFENVNRD